MYFRTKVLSKVLCTFVQLCSVHCTRTCSGMLSAAFEGKLFYFRTKVQYLRTKVHYFRKYFRTFVRKYFRTKVLYSVQLYTYCTCTVRISSPSTVRAELSLPVNPPPLPRPRPRSPPSRGAKATGNDASWATSPSRSYPTSGIASLARPSRTRSEPHVTLKTSTRARQRKSSSWSPTRHATSTPPRLRVLATLTPASEITSWSCLLRERIIRREVCSHYVVHVHVRVQLYTYSTCTAL